VGINVFLRRLSNLKTTLAQDPPGAGYLYMIFTNNEPPVTARLLLVDDDLKFCKLLAGYLESQGFVIGVAHDGAAALQLVKENTWDLMVLDVMMPGIDGFEVLNLLRRGSAVPVLMLTGRGTESDLVRGLDAGADDYVPKTASARELLARINALLRRSAVKASAQDKAADVRADNIEVGGLRIDPEARTVEVDGKPITLTAFEYALLVCLVRHKGRVRSREQLLQEASERRFENFDRSVDVHIASLRRKLGDDSRSARFIRTVRAAGYLLVDPEQEAP
jgi:DNA-binding response OmpR family regulator